MIFSASWSTRELRGLLGCCVMLRVRLTKDSLEMATHVPTTRTPADTTCDHDIIRTSRNPKEETIELIDDCLIVSQFYKVYNLDVIEMIFWPKQENFPGYIRPADMQRKCLFYTVRRDRAGQTTVLYLRWIESLRDREATEHSWQRSLQPSWLLSWLITTVSNNVLINFLQNKYQISHVQNEVL